MHPTCQTFPSFRLAKVEAKALRTLDISLRTAIVPFLSTLGTREGPWLLTDSWKLWAKSTTYLSNTVIRIMASHFEPG